MSNGVDIPKSILMIKGVSARWIPGHEVKGTAYDTLSFVGQHVQYLASVEGRGRRVFRL
jgi:hypothetical protein